MNSAEQNIENLFKNLQTETDSLGESTCAELKIPSDFVSNATREELIALAESGKIKYSVNYIKKASHAALDKIKADYERKHLDETNEYVTNNILSSVVKLLEYFNMVKNPDELEQELKENSLLKRDIKNIVGVVTPSIPYVGLLCGGVTVGKHVAINALNDPITPARPNVSGEPSVAKEVS